LSEVVRNGFALVTLLLFYVARIVQKLRLVQRNSLTKHRSCFTPCGINCVFYLKMISTL